MLNAADIRIVLANIASSHLKNAEKIINNVLRGIFPDVRRKT